VQPRCNTQLLYTNHTFKPHHSALLQWQRWLTVEARSCLQQSRFGVALPVLKQPQPEGGPATTRLSKRLECSSAVSSRLSDIAHSQAEKANRQNYWLTVGKCLCTVDVTCSYLVLIILTRQYVATNNGTI
jgi:hypothetical protein